MGPSRVRTLPAIHRLLGTPHAPGGRGATQCMTGRVLGMPQGARCSAQPPSTRACPSVPLSFPPAPSMCSPRASHVFPPRFPCVPPALPMCSPRASHVFPPRFPCVPPALPMCSPRASHVFPPRFPCVPPALPMCSPRASHVFPPRFPCVPPALPMCSPRASHVFPPRFPCVPPALPMCSPRAHVPPQVPRERKIANVQSLGFGALFAPTPPLPASAASPLLSPSASTLPSPTSAAPASSQPPPVVRHAPLRCAFCGACVCLYSAIAPATGDWRCALCGRPNMSGGHYLLAEGETLEGWPELGARVVDYVEAGGGARGAGEGGVGGGASEAVLGAPVVVVVDEGLDAACMGGVRAALTAMLQHLPSATRIAIITFGAALSLFDLSPSASPLLASADCFPATHALPAATLAALLLGRAQHLAPIAACLPSAQAVIASLRPCRAATPPLARARALGPAVDLALALLRGPAPALPRASQRRWSGAARVVVLCGGPATVGAGAVAEGIEGVGEGEERQREQAARRHYEALGREARRMGAVVDVFSGGPLLVRVPALLPLAALSGGALVPLDEFSPAAFPPLLLRALSRIVGAEGSLEVRCSPEVAVTRVIGPAEAEEGGGRRGAGGEEGFPEDSATAVALLSVDEEAAVAVSMELTDDLTRHHVFFQFLCRFRLLNHDLAASLPAYLSSVHEPTAALLIAKRTVLAAPTAREAGEMRAWVDARARDLALKLGGVAQHNRSLLQFPHQLPRVAEALYEVRRSPVLGRHVAGEWERQALRALLLRAGGEAALRMVLPSLLMFRAGHATQFVEVPPSDLALTSDAALVLDHGTDMLIWLGAHLAPDEPTRRGVEAACRQLAAQLMGGPGGRGRFPAPRVLCFTPASSTCTPRSPRPVPALPMTAWQEGTAEAAFMTARLTPTHKDPLAVQCCCLCSAPAHLLTVSHDPHHSTPTATCVPPLPARQELLFPPLREMQEEERAAVRAKLPPTPEPGFTDWLRSLRLAPPQPPLAAPS
ncbi:unnamed protein product [Closterium sp. Naga37s-1]|nr:unnamed protein product [Closterium sp. Naga37s-1]